MVADVRAAPAVAAVRRAAAVLGGEYQVGPVDRYEPLTVVTRLNV